MFRSSLFTDECLYWVSRKIFPCVENVGKCLAWNRILYQPMTIDHSHKTMNVRSSSHSHNSVMNSLQSIIHRKSENFLFAISFDVVLQKMRMMEKEKSKKIVSISNRRGNFNIFTILWPWKWFGSFTSFFRSLHQKEVVHDSTLWLYSFLLHVVCIPFYTWI